ncbi:mediator of RNA polymerase II transcription subunit [Striga asiatica]|uniref:Mediator of RNA polymerase II transcription subunit n=1 Tax=Striga asiatica TaxID=4170 RepID=A0A5A7RDN3_STRAF|nr:mediator of RNA polymerase II transcription subunit [Striga asiatica]
MANSCKSSDSDSDDAKEDAYAAVAYSRMMEYNFISPEHIIMFTVDDGSINRVLKSGTLSYIAILLVLGFTHMQSICLDFVGEENTGVIKGVALHVSSEQNGQMATPPRVVPPIGCGGAASPYSGRSLHHEESKCSNSCLQPASACHVRAMVTIVPLVPTTPNDLVEDIISKVFYCSIVN